MNDDVTNVFKGKTTSQLMLLEEQIKKKLAGGEGIDVGYWEALVQQLKAHMAKTRLRERHQEVLRQKLFKLKQEVGFCYTIFEPRHEKTCQPVKTQTGLLSYRDLHIKKLEILNYLGSEQQRYWSDCEDVQANLRLYCSHMA